MSNSLEEKICVSTEDDLFRAIQEIMPKLSKMDRRLLNSIVIRFATQVGWIGAFERLNGKTVQQIFVEFADQLSTGLLEKGEVDDVTYVLYEAKHEQRGHEE